MYTTDTGSTWAGTHTFRATGIHQPTTVAEAASIVGAHNRIRAIGTRHSFNDVADGETLISMLDIAPDFELDASARTVTVGAGTRYGVLAAWLQSQGFALRNMGSLPHISIAGASATGTHGSGNTNGILATAVAALQLITAEGALVQFDRSHPDFAGLLPSLGATGVIARVTLVIEPTYLVRQDLYSGLAWDVAFAELEAVMGAGYSVSLSTTWVEPAISRVLVKRRVALQSAAPDRVFDAELVRPGNPVLEQIGANYTAQDGSSVPWLEGLPHFRVDSPPSFGDEIQSEYFIALADGAAALRVIRELGDQIAPLLFQSEIRSIGADDLWLSGAYGRTSLAIHFTWRNKPDQVNAVLPIIEAALEPFAARPHWGKTFTLQPKIIRSLYPKFHDFIDLVHRMDPSGKFSNDYERRVLGVE